MDVAWVWIAVWVAADPSAVSAVDGYDDEPPMVEADTGQLEPSELPEPLEPSELPEPSESSFEGPFASLGAGLSGCGLGCSDLYVGGIARLEAGYRWPHVALGVSFSLGGGDLGRPDLPVAFEDVKVRGSLRYVHAAPFVQVHFVDSGPVDPWIAVGLGVHRLMREFVASQDEVGARLRTWENAGGLRLGVGAPFAVGPRVMVGPRFDYVFPIQGQLCQTLDGEPTSEAGRCIGWNDALDGVGGEARRALRRGRARPWSVALEIRFLF